MDLDFCLSSSLLAEGIHFITSTTQLAMLLSGDLRTLGEESMLDLENQFLHSRHGFVVKKRSALAHCLNNFLELFFKWPVGSVMADLAEEQIIR